MLSKILIPPLHHLIDNFCWPVRTLSIEDDKGQRRKRTPAMAAGLTDHIWITEEWITYPAKAG